MILSKKWILFCFVITAFLLTASSQPTPTSIVKRQEVANDGADNSSVADYHHATLTRTSTTATATSTNKGGKGGAGGTPTSSGDKNSEPSVIPAKTPAWYGKV